MERTWPPQEREKDLGVPVALLLTTIQLMHVSHVPSSDILLLVSSLTWLISYLRGLERRGSPLPTPGYGYLDLTLPIRSRDRAPLWL